MTLLYNILLSISIAVLFFIFTSRLLISNKFKLKIFYFFNIICILTMLFILHNYFGYFNTIEIKGGNPFKEWMTLIALYIATIFGMLADYIFTKASESKRKFFLKKELRSMLATVLVSPIIFIPTLSTFDNSISQANTTAKFLLQFFVAFQNGFFWKALLSKTILLKNKEE